MANYTYYYDVHHPHVVYNIDPDLEGSACTQEARWEGQYDTIHQRDNENCNKAFCPDWKIFWRTKKISFCDRQEMKSFQAEGPLSRLSGSKKYITMVDTDWLIGWLAVR